MMDVREGLPPSRERGHSERAKGFVADQSARHEAMFPTNRGPRVWVHVGSGEGWCALRSTDVRTRTISLRHSDIRSVSVRRRGLTLSQ